MNKLIFDVGLAAKLKVAFARNGWTAEMIDMACQGDSLGQFKDLLLRRAVLTPIEYRIDTDAQPADLGEKIGKGGVKEHEKGGSFVWDESKIRLYTSRSGQQGGMEIAGTALRKSLKSNGLHPLNATVLDFLLANQNLIPEEWKEKDNIFFWGTTYHGWHKGDTYVRYLSWSWGSGEWFSGDKNVNEWFKGNDFAAIFAD